jgi:hypothetical protein
MLREHGEGLSFSALAIQTIDVPPPFVIPAKTGMTKSGVALRPECKKSFETIEPTLSPFTLYFCKGERKGNSKDISSHTDSQSFPDSKWI